MQTRARALFSGEAAAAVFGAALLWHGRQFALERASRGTALSLGGEEGETEREEIDGENNNLFSELNPVAGLSGASTVPDRHSMALWNSAVSDAAKTVRETARTFSSAFSSDLSITVNEGNRQSTADKWGNGNSGNALLLRALLAQRLTVFAQEQPQQQQTSSGVKASAGNTGTPQPSGASGALPPLSPLSISDQQQKQENDESFEEKFQSTVGWLAEKIGFPGRTGEPDFGHGQKRLLPPELPEPFRRPYVLVIDLKALVHTTWSQRKGWQTKKRAGVDFFLSHLSNFYEIVIFTDDPAAQARTVVDRMDTTGFISHRLYKEQMAKRNGKLVKDISNLGRDPATTIMIDSNKINCDIQPENCMLLKPWEGKDDESALLDLIPLLEQIAQQGVTDVRDIVKTYQGRDPAEVWHQRRISQQHKPTEGQKAGTVWDRFK